MNNKKLLLSCLFFLIFFLPYYKTKILNKLNYIFTFWEPKNKLPGYLRLGLMTWKKYLINYKIILLDYSNLPRYLDSNILSKIKCKHFSLPIQADAIRVAILQKYGGIWMDPDTIITNPSILNIIKKLKRFELAMIGDKDNNIVHIGFIYAKKNSKILKKWLNGIIEHIKFSKQIIYLKKYYQNNAIINSWENVRIWNYLGNGIIDPLLKKAKGRQFLLVDRIKINAFPELTFQSKKENHTYLYTKCFFSQGKAQSIANSSKGLILLHNSWTPEKYKKMSEDEFIKQNIILSNLLKLILNKI